MSCRKNFVPTIHTYFDNEFGTVGMEIGCDSGGMSNAIMEIMKPSLFYMVDPWETLDNIRNGPRDSAKMKVRYDRAMAQPFIKDNSNVIIHKMKSEFVFELIPDNSLDWVFIDGDHTYWGVRDDLAGVYPKMKPNGIIFGDDYTWRNKYGDEEEENIGRVGRAVDEFVSENKSTIETVTYPDGCYIIELNK